MKLTSVAAAIFALFFTCSCVSHNGGKEQKEQIPDQININDDAGFFSYLDLNYPGLEEVKKYVRKGNTEKAKIAYLRFRREKSQAKWNIVPTQKPASASVSSYPAADRIMQHYVRFERIYNNTEVFLGEDINWFTNPLEASQPDFDSQFSHSLSRTAFWNTLGQAYWATLNEKYAKEWVYQMTDFVKDNPVDLKSGAGSGPLAWWTLNPGIRMAGSWMNAYYSFLLSPEFSADAHLTFVKGVIEHGQRLEKITVENPGRSGNWIAMECNGLGTIGILFPELKKAADYRKVAFERLNSELDKQVYPDGSEVELTPSYHQVSLTNFMQLASLAQKNNIVLPEGFLDKLKNMYAFNLNLMDPSGVLPPLNDASPTKAATSLKEAYDIWKDEQFLFGATAGKEGTKPEYDSYFFNWAGYYVMRSGWKKSDNCLYFDAGPVGFAHEHEDMLNLYLYSHGKILLTEPGTYSYDQSEWRRYVLSTAAHNTILVDGKGQHRGDIPASRLIKEPLKNPWVNSPFFDYGEGTYASGYQESQYVPVQYMPVKYVGRKDSSISHTRHVIFLKPFYYVAVDFLEGTGMHKYDAHFHLDAPDAKINKTTMAVNTRRTDTVQLGLFPMDITGLKARIVKGQENPILGWLPKEKRQIPTVVYTMEKVPPVTFSTFIYPYLSKEPQINYKKIMTDNKGVWAERITTPNESVSIVIRRNGDKTKFKIDPLISPSFSANADVIVVRKPLGIKEDHIGFYNISEYKDKIVSFNLAQPSSLLLMKTGGRILFFNPMEEAIEINFTVPYTLKFLLPVNKWVDLTPAGLDKTANAHN